MIIPRREGQKKYDDGVIFKRNLDNLDYLQTITKIWKLWINTISLLAYIKCPFKEKRVVANFQIRVFFGFNIWQSLDVTHFIIPYEADKTPPMDRLPFRQNILRKYLKSTSSRQPCSTSAVVRAASKNNGQNPERFTNLLWCLVGHSKCSSRCILRTKNTLIQNTVVRIYTHFSFSL